MPFPFKIQPVDFSSPVGPAFLKPVVKSRLKRLFERPFGNVLRIAGPEKGVMDGGNDQEYLEPSSVCLDIMVKNFIEESGDKQVNSSDSDDEFDSRHTYVCQVLKKLVMCSSVSERNLLADTANIYEKNKLCKCKIEHIRKSVTDGLIALGYDASICKSRWEKAPTYPAGEYDYVDVIKEDDDKRLIVDIDFRSEFKIARSTKKYNTILQILPQIFVGKADRLEKIVYIVSDAAKQSLNNNGMPFPPWRRAEYVKSKWLSPYTRTPPQQYVTPPPLTIMDSTDLAISDIENLVIQTRKTTTSPVIAGVKSPASSDHSDTVFSMSQEEEAKLSF